MGKNADGILAYGFDLGGPEEGWKVQFAGVDEDESPDWFDDEDEDADFQETAMARLLAAVGFDEEWEPGKDGYHIRKAAAEKQVGVTFEYHCSNDYPQYLLAAKTYTTGQGHTENVDLSLPGNADERLAWALGVLGIEVGDTKPVWLLACCLS